MLLFVGSIGKLLLLSRAGTLLIRNGLIVPDFMREDKQIVVRNTLEFANFPGMGALYSKKKYYLQVFFNIGNNRLFSLFSISLLDSHFSIHYIKWALVL